MRLALLSILAALVSSIAASSTDPFLHDGALNLEILKTCSMLDAVRFVRAKRFPLPEFWKKKDALILQILLQTLKPSNKRNPKQAAAIISVLEDAGFGALPENRQLDLNPVKLSPTQMITFMRLAYVDSESVHPSFKGKSIVDYIKVNPVHALVTAWNAKSVERQIRDKRMINYLKRSISLPLVIDDSNATNQVMTDVFRMISTSKVEFPICLHSSMFLRAVATMPNQAYSAVWLLCGQSGALPVIHTLVQTVAVVAERLASMVGSPMSDGCFVKKAAQDLKAYLNSPGAAQHIVPAKRQELQQWLVKCKELHKKTVERV